MSAVAIAEPRLERARRNPAPPPSPVAERSFRHDGR
jgi:hypothetical protein